METELARAVDVMMARAKIIYVLIINVNKLFSFFVAMFSNRQRKHVVCVESLGEQEKANLGLVFPQH